MSMCATSVERGLDGSQGKRLSFELRLPLSIRQKELGSLHYILSLGHLRCQNMHAIVSTPSGTTRAKNEGRRACDAKTRHQMAQKRR